MKHLKVGTTIKLQSDDEIKEWISWNYPIRELDYFTYIKHLTPLPEIDKDDTPMSEMRFILTELSYGIMEDLENDFKR